MVSIPGHLEYDDESLTPGQKKEGGLHSNLYDSEGKLKGNARFIPGDSDNAESAGAAAGETYGISEEWEGGGSLEYEDEEEERRRRENREAGALFLAEVTSRLLIYALEKGGPPAARMWNERTRPALAVRWAKIRRRQRPGDPDLSEEPTLEIEVSVSEFSQVLADHDSQYQIHMAELRGALADMAPMLAAPMAEEAESNPQGPGDGTERSDAGPTS